MKRREMIYGSCLLITLTWLCLCGAAFAAEGQKVVGEISRIMAFRQSTGKVFKLIGIQIQLKEHPGKTFSVEFNTNEEAEKKGVMTKGADEKYIFSVKEGQRVEISYSKNKNSYEVLVVKAMNPSQ